MTERAFQRALIRKLKKMFPECTVLKNDANYIQGFPDLTVLAKGGWAVLECKAHRNAARQPNQEYYINKLNKIGFARFIYPENKAKVLKELQQWFQRKTITKSPISLTDAMKKAG